MNRLSRRGGKLTEEERDNLIHQIQVVDIDTVATEAKTDDSHKKGKDDKADMKREKTPAQKRGVKRRKIQRQREKPPSTAADRGKRLKAIRMQYLGQVGATSSVDQYMARIFK